MSGDLHLGNEPFQANDVQQNMQVQVPVQAQGHQQPLPQLQELLHLSGNLLNEKLARLGQIDLAIRAEFIQIFDLIDLIANGGKVDPTHLLNVCERLGVRVDDNFPLMRVLDGLKPHELVAAEQLKNILVNRQLYLLDVQQFLQDNRERIFEGFEWEGAMQGAQNPPQITFLGGETHSKGKIPLVVVTMTANGVEKSLVLKPRDGRVDQRILQLFHQINQLDIDARTGIPERTLNDGPPPQLNSYKILTPDQEWDIPAHLQPLCLCEFVGTENVLGQHIDGRGIAGPGQRWAGAQKIGDTTSVDRFFKKRLQYLQQGRDVIAQKVRNYRFQVAVFTHLGVQDQHNGNYRFDPNSPCPMIPVDMEVISDHAESTDMCTLFAPLPLTDDELALVHLTKEELNSNGEQPFRRRLVLIPTSAFLGILEHISADKVVNLVMNEQIGGQAWFNAEMQNALKERVISDYLNYDVPVFTKVGNQIFYGEPHEGLLLN